MLPHPSLQQALEVLTSREGFQSFQDPGEDYIRYERTYKDDASASVRKLFAPDGVQRAIATRNIVDLQERLATFMRNNGFSNLMGWRDVDMVFRPIATDTGREDDLVRFFSTVTELFTPEHDVAEVVDRMAAALHGREAGQLKGHMWACMSYFCMMIRPERYIFVKPRVTDAFFKAIGSTYRRPVVFSGAAYKQLLDVCHGVAAELAELGYPPLDLIDLQSFMWILNDEETAPPRRPPTRELIRAAAKALQSDAGFTAQEVAEWLEERHPRDDGRPWQANMLQVGDFAVWADTGEICSPSTAGETSYPKFLECLTRQPPYRYRQIEERPTPLPAKHTQTDKTLYDFFRDRELFLSDEVLTNYALALKTKPFVILTGISGTGKTKIAQLFAEYFCPDEVRATSEASDSDVRGTLRPYRAKTAPPSRSDRYAFISVQPHWTDNRGLLGYYNPLLDTYVATDFLKLMLRAASDPKRPYFIILDEMNLAKVEHYFADFLSCLESRRPGPDGQLVQERIALHQQPGPLEIVDKDGAYMVPPSMEIPTNLYFTGTVNVDESTYMFSPKVLDRANTIEFNHVDLAAYGGLVPSVSASGPFALSDTFSLGPLALPSKQHFDNLRDEAKALLIELNTILAPAQLHFGYRVANEIALYLRHVEADVGSEAWMTALDLQILQKVLPKLHGSRGKLETPLQELLRFCSQSDRFPRSGAKVQRMLQALRDQGYASFIT